MLTAGAFEDLTEDGVEVDAGGGFDAVAKGVGLRAAELLEVERIGGGVDFGFSNVSQKAPWSRKACCSFRCFSNLSRST